MITNEKDTATRFFLRWEATDRLAVVVTAINAISSC